MINAFMYILVIALLFFKVTTEKITLIFFILAICIYLTGAYLDANHYMSVVYIFIVVSVVKQLYRAVGEKAE